LDRREIVDSGALQGKYFSQGYSQARKNGKAVPEGFEKAYGFSKAFRNQTGAFFINYGSKWTANDPP